jgi:hypothetical protein
MAFGNLFGSNGVLEQLLLWGVANQVVSSLAGPAFTALQQDVNAKHPDLALTPELAAQAVARHLLTDVHGQAEAARGGIDQGRFATMVEAARTRLTPEVLATAVERHLVPESRAQHEAELQGMDPADLAVMQELAKVRLSPADLAEAQLRSYITAGQAEAEAAPQGITAEQLRILADLAGDAPGADQLVMALRRGIIAHHGRGAGETSYDQGIRETRLHDKWGPVLEALGQAVLSPPDAASAVIRNFMNAAEGQAEAGKSGVPPDLFAVLTHLAGDAPGPQQLAEALRRGAIPKDGTGPGSVSFTQGIAEGRLSDKWAPVIEALAKLWPTPVDALDAALKGQVTPDEGKRLYELLGGDIEFYPWLLDSQGEGPSPLEAISMANRGFIPWDGTGPGVISYEQAFRESRWRDKWAPVYRQYADYLPPPETVRTLLEQGSIDQATAVQLWHKSGLDETTVGAYLQAAAFNNTAATRGLAINEVLNMYYGQLIGDTETGQLLELFHVPEHTAGLLMSYTLVRRSIAAVTAATSRVKSLLAARKIGADTARQALARLQIPGSTIDGLISAWEVEASITVKVLTEAQIVDAWVIGALTQAEAEADLAAIGYTPYDAWTLLSIKVKTPLPDKPDRIVAAPAGTVTPGVT